MNLRGAPFLLISALCGGLLLGCSSKSSTPAASAQSSESPANSQGFLLQSSDFVADSDIAKKFTCSGPDASPALRWSGTPAKTQTLALIVDDPDAPAGTWVHWVIYDLPAKVNHLPQGVPKQAQLAGGRLQGTNDFHKIGYNGPCPPPGASHRYFFKLYALDSKLNLKAGATKDTIEKAMQGHILAQTSLTGRFAR